MANYQLKYSQEYTSLNKSNCKIEIYEDGYSGPVKELPLTEDAVKQSWQTDDPKATIKGCVLTINIESNTGLTMDDFYSNNDYQFKVFHYVNNTITFIGFLVQDDFQEDFIDFTHAITLSANDGLSLLKNTDLGTYIPDDILQMQYVVNPPGVTGCYLYFLNINYSLPPGVPFLISDHTDTNLNTVFNAIECEQLSGKMFRLKVTPLPGVPSSGLAACKVNSKGAFNLLGMCSLASILYACLYPTNLSLGLQEILGLYEARQDTTIGFLEQTFVDGKSFYNDIKFESCYTVLDKILARFDATLFQDKGSWVIIRWNYVRYGLAVTNFYDQHFVHVSKTSQGGFNKQFGFEKQFYPEYAIVRKAVRPIKFSKQTFEYKQPKYIIKNNDLQDLGPMYREYDLGAFHDREYVLNEFYNLDTNGGFESGIRVVTDSSGTETQRFVYMKGFIFPYTTGDETIAVAATPFEVSQGDKVKISFKTRGIGLALVSGVIHFVVKITDGTDTYYAVNGDRWATTGRFDYIIPGSPDMQHWKDIDINPGAAPINGLVTFYYNHYTPPSLGVETQYKDLTVELVPLVNDSSKIISQTHLYEQTPDIKNNADKTIYLDDAVRSSMSGVMYLNEFTDNLRHRTETWFSLNDPTFIKKLGELITTEDVFSKLNRRDKLEGVYHGKDLISLFSLIEYYPLLNSIFIFGYLNINFKKGSFDCTLFQLFDTTETKAQMIGSYTFKFNYNLK